MVAHHPAPYQIGRRVARENFFFFPLFYPSFFATRDAKVFTKNTIRDMVFTRKSIFDFFDAKNAKVRKEKHKKSLRLLRPLRQQTPCNNNVVIKLISVYFYACHDFFNLLFYLHGKAASFRMTPSFHSPNPKVSP